MQIGLGGCGLGGGGMQGGCGLGGWGVQGGRILKKQTKTNRGRRVQAYLHVHSVKKIA